jgi:hypothetical protein
VKTGISLQSNRGAYFGQQVHRHAHNGLNEILSLNRFEVLPRPACLSYLFTAKSANPGLPNPARHLHHNEDLAVRIMLSTGKTSQALVATIQRKPMVSIFGEKIRLQGLRHQAFFMGQSFTARLVESRH